MAKWWWEKKEKDNKSVQNQLKKQIILLGHAFNFKRDTLVQIFKKQEELNTNPI